ncbi:MAG: insulinase family protein [Myxococcales bacterium]|nr:MAG: insulinase family protein [Myxococcales bacterium]
MKTLLMFVLALLVAIPSARADEIAYDFALSNGMKVIHVPLAVNDVIALHLVLPGAAARQNESDAGIETMLLEAMTRGSERFPKDVMNRELDRMGARIGPQVGYDYASLRLLTLRPFFGRSLEILADAFLRPALDPAEIERVREQQLAAIRAKDDSPDEFIAKTLNDRFYAGHLYHSDMDGALESVAALTIDDLRAHAAKLAALDSAFIVVAGKLDREELRHHLEKWFGELKHAPSPAYAPPPHKALPGELVVADRPYPTHYLLGKFPAPAPRDGDYPALRLGLKILSQRLWEKVRTDRGLAYAVSGGLSSYAANFGYVYMSTTATSQALPVMWEEIARLAAEPAPDSEFVAAKAVYRTEYFMALEDMSGQADFLAFGELYMGDWRRRNEIADNVQAATAEDVRRAMAQWTRDIAFAVVGPADKIDRAFFAPPAVSLEK